MTKKNPIQIYTVLTTKVRTKKILLTANTTYTRRKKRENLGSLMAEDEKERGKDWRAYIDLLLHYCYLIFTFL